jgi:hypothetical protein
MRITATLTLLLLTAFTSVTFALGSPPAPPNQLTFIVANMERAQAAVNIPNHVKRDYKLGRPNASAAESEVIADVDFRAPGNYTVEQHSGSNMGPQIVKRVLAREVGIAVSSDKSRSAAVTHENYLFSFLGEARLNGQSYYLLGLEPKRKQSELISGQAWVDKQSFLIRRIDGTIKSPSMWVKKIHTQLDFDFDPSQRMWVLSNMEAVADVRFLGARKLTSHVINYEATSVVAHNTAPPRIARKTGRATSAAALLSK